MIVNCKIAYLTCKSIKPRWKDDACSFVGSLVVAVYFNSLFFTNSCTA